MGCTSSAPPAPSTEAPTSPTVPGRRQGAKFARRYAWLPGKPLGRGNFAVVKRAVYTATKTTVAVKCFCRQSLNKEDEDAVFVEVDVLTKVRGSLDARVAPVPPVAPWPSGAPVPAFHCGYVCALKSRGAERPRRRPVALAPPIVSCCLAYRVRCPASPARPFLSRPPRVYPRS